MVIDNEFLYGLSDNKAQFNWAFIQDSIFNFLVDKAKQNHIEVDPNLLFSYAGEIFTHYRENGVIYSSGYDTDNMQPFFDRFESEVFKIGWCPRALLVMKLLFYDKLEGE